MSEFLKRWWQLITGCEMAERTAYSKGYAAGFQQGRAAVDHWVRAARGVGYLDGFAEGRESTRTVPLDAGNPQLDEDDQEVPCRRPH